MPRRRRKEDTSVSLHPLSLEEAVRGLANVARHEDSEAEGCDSTTEVALSSEPAKPRTSQHRSSSDD